MFGRAAPLLVENQLLAGMYGIVFSQRARGEARDNRCKSHSEHGILVQEDAAPSLVDEICEANGRCGIRWQAGSTGGLSGNRCCENREVGILVSGATFPPTAGNTCERNRRGQLLRVEFPETINEGIGDDCVVTPKGGPGRRLEQRRLDPEELESLAGELQGQELLLELTELPDPTGRTTCRLSFAGLGFQGRVSWLRAELRGGGRVELTAVLEGDRWGWHPPDASWYFVRRSDFGRDFDAAGFSRWSPEEGLAEVEGRPGTLWRVDWGVRVLRSAAPDTCWVQKHNGSHIWLCSWPEAEILAGLQPSLHGPGRLRILRAAGHGLLVCQAEGTNIPDPRVHPGRFCWVARA